MEALSETKWDAVISGTWLQQSLLALNVLHVDPNEFYGGPEAAFSLQEVDEWAERHSAEDADAVFSAAVVSRLGDGLSFPRAYSLALAPQVIHARSKLLTQLVSSKAFRQVEFLAVGSFYIYQPASKAAPAALSRIPSTREDVFSNTAIPTRAKRMLMKFLKFVLEYETEPQTQVWKPRANEPLTQLLASEFKLDAHLQSYVVTLTLSLDGKVTVEAGLAAISRHLTSIGVFGAGFAAVYPKWGGLSEVAQVGCRAGAVGGAVYMLGTGIKDVREADSELEITLANDVAVKSKTLVQGSERGGKDGVRVSRLTAVVASDLSPVFASTVEGSPTPAVAVVAFPVGSISAEDGTSASFPIYATVHSSDTGECPAGQSVVYLSTISTPQARRLLETALSALLATQKSPSCLYKLAYEQSGHTPSLDIQGNVATFASSSLGLAFDDSVLDPVREAWDMVTRDKVDKDAEYMQFEDREGVNDDEDD